MMNRTGLRSKLRTTTQNFAADRKGTVAMIFAGAFVPIVAVAGISADDMRPQKSAV